MEKRKLKPWQTGCYASVVATIVIIVLIALGVLVSPEIFSTVPVLGYLMAILLNYSPLIILAVGATAYVWSRYRQ